MFIILTTQSMASYYTSFSVVFFSLLFSFICLISSVQSINNGGVTIDLIHRDSPYSPAYDTSKTRFDRLRKAFDRSFSRKSSLLSTSLRSSKSIDRSVEAPLTNNGGEYLIKYKIGTPPVEQFSIADTGSDLTWIQCKPCTQCYKQNFPLFDTTKTSTYRAVSCDSAQCSAAGSSGCGDNNACQYEVSYGDRSRTTGDLAAETLTLGPNASFPKVVFGCGYNNAGTFAETGSGIVGLGGGSISIVKQLERTIGGTFSYCLTSIGVNVSSKISFGSNAIVTGPKVVSTPLVSKSPETYYYLTLEGLSVGKERLDYKPSRTNQVSDEGNIIIDSGTTLTFVPSQLYDGFESSFVKAVKGTPTSDPQGTFSVCYESSSSLEAPPITAHFDGADLLLPQESILLEVEEGIACLTLVPSQDIAIFGNLHQVNYNIGYDLVKQQVNFLPTDCSKPQ